MGAGYEIEFEHNTKCFSFVTYRWGTGTRLGRRDRVATPRVVDRRGVDLGQNVYLAVIRRESDGQLFGVPWGDEVVSIDVGNYSEEDINEKLPIIPLWARTTTKTVIETVTVYEGAGRSLLSELDVQL